MESPLVVRDLWEKENFFNSNILYLFNKDIREYDMKEAGFSLIKEYNLLPEETIQDLKELGKEHRTKEIGKLQIGDLHLKSGLKVAFQTARQKFILTNELQRDQIISVKKDAIFTTVPCKHQKFGSFIDFREKHQYSSYLVLNGGKRSRYEIYYSPTDFAVKGIVDEKLAYHEDYMIWFLKKWFQKMETETKDQVLEFTTRFIDKYKRRELNVGFYRRFNGDSDYILKGQQGVRYMEYWDEAKDQLDISYNYQKILIPLIKIPL